ncbi:hypothetical protein JYU34_005379 [Plutella xylostella]|uniref:Pseudouridine synthase I TruA alpha/beta domain-containing protein n=2 Tax=Plutella xylostella TaxID=51655 RepID=A0ABQ7QWJ1_PLUXY|nr:hypothetical protein JYU34_005379 [Plutella xylostella]
MSVGLFKIFSNILKQNLPRLHLKTGPVRGLAAAMDVAVTEDNEVVSNKKFTRFRKRQWENYSKKENDGSENKRTCDGDKPFERIKKKKMAMLLGYCGVDYYGMQRNPGVPTIEEELLKALLEAKYISDEDFKNQQNAQFQRSSRTDKGVSAARQVVSLKMPLEVHKEEINSRLPECIRVFGIKRVTNKFNSKGKCNARTYSYTLPTYVFESSLITVEDRKKYRITPEKLEEVNKVLGVYKGTKSYHNFTEKKHHTDPSASRFMMSFGVEKVFVDSEMEFAVLLVKGQSFMLHQIRKMVGLTIAVVRGHTDMATLEKSFGKEKVMIPTAPGLGLVLDMVHYDRYDARYKTSHDSLTWQDEEEAVQKFKHDHIYPVIVRGELEGNAIGEWIDTKLIQHSYEPSDDVPLEKGEENEIEMGGDDDDEDDTAPERETTTEDSKKDHDKSSKDSVVDAKTCEKENPNEGSEQSDKIEVSEFSVKEIS